MPVPTPRAPASVVDRPYTACKKGGGKSLDTSLCFNSGALETVLRHCPQTRSSKRSDKVDKVTKEEKNNSRPNEREAASETWECADTRFFKATGETGTGESTPSSFLPTRHRRMTSKDVRISKAARSRQKRRDILIFTPTIMPHPDRGR
jgi:hypothetical protein